MKYTFETVKPDEATILMQADAMLRVIQEMDNRLRAVVKYGDNDKWSTEIDNAQHWRDELRVLCEDYNVRTWDI